MWPTELLNLCAWPFQSFRHNWCDILSLRSNTCACLGTLLICIISLSSRASASVPDLQIIPQPEYQVSFQHQERELLRYHFDPRSKRPFWYPALTSTEASLVRMGHPHDPHGHRHHYGIWLAHASLNGVNFWDDDKDSSEHPKGSIQHQRVIGLWDGDKSAAMLSVNHWVADRDQKILLVERRFQEIRLIPDTSSWLLVIESEFLAPKGTTATFDVSAFGLSSVRLTKYIGVHDGGGRILNSEGQLNEKAIFRKPAR